MKIEKSRIKIVNSSKIIENFEYSTSTKVISKGNGMLPNSLDKILDERIEDLVKDFGIDKKCLASIYKESVDHERMRQVKEKISRQIFNARSQELSAVSEMLARFLPDDAERKDLSGLQNGRELQDAIVKERVKYDVMTVNSKSPDSGIADFFPHVDDFKEMSCDGEHFPTPPPPTDDDVCAYSPIDESPTLTADQAHTFTTTMLKSKHKRKRKAKGKARARRTK